MTTYFNRMLSVAVPLTLGGIDEISNTNLMQWLASNCKIAMGEIRVVHQRPDIPILVIGMELAPVVVRKQTDGLLWYFRNMSSVDGDEWLENTCRCLARDVISEGLVTNTDLANRICAMDLTNLDIPWRIGEHDTIRI